EAISPEFGGKGLFSVENKSQGYAMRIKSAYGPACNIPVDNLAGGDVTVFICGRPQILYPGRKFHTGRDLRKIRVIPEILHDPGMGSGTDKRIRCRVRNPWRELLRVFDSGHLPWKTIMMPLPDPEHFFRLIVIA